MTLVLTDDAAMTDVEQSRLRVKEAAIERGFRSAGEALRDIRNERLYKGTHNTFEAYCRERWGMSKRNADYEISAVEVGEVLGTIVPTGQARELTALTSDPDELRATYQRAVEATGGNVTAKAIREARQPPTAPDAEDVIDAELVEDEPASSATPWRDGLKNPDEKQRENWRTSFKNLKSIIDLFAENVSGDRRSELAEYLLGVASRLKESE